MCQTILVVQPVYLLQHLMPKNIGFSKFKPYLYHSVHLMIKQLVPTLLCVSTGIVRLYVCYVPCNVFMH